MKPVSLIPLEKVPGHNMRIKYFDDYTLLSSHAAFIVQQEVERKKDLLLCAATGSSPLGLYRQLAAYSRNHPLFFDHIRLLKLDEWVGIPMSSHGSCEQYLREQLTGPLGISSDRHHAFNSEAPSLEVECIRIQEVMDREGPIDVCILGLGKNGHLGFNEPGSSFTSHCHLATLLETSKAHAMVHGYGEKPTLGMTIGINDILSSKRILLIVSGKGKMNAKEMLFSGEVNASCPATCLWTHDNVDCLILKED